MFYKNTCCVNDKLWAVVFNALIFIALRLIMNECIKSVSIKSIYFVDL